MNEKSRAIIGQKFRESDVRVLQREEGLEMIHFTGDIYEKHVLQHLLPFTISKIFHFSRQKLVLR